MLRKSLCFAPFSFSSTLTSLFASALKHDSYSMMPPPGCCTVGVVLGRCWMLSGFVIPFPFRIQAKQENMFPHSLPSSHSALKPGRGLQRWLSLWNFIPSLHRISRAPSEWSSDSSAWCRTSSLTSPCCAKRLPFENYSPDLCLAIVLTLSSPGSSFDLVAFVLIQYALSCKSPSTEQCVCFCKSCPINLTHHR